MSKLAIPGITRVARTRQTIAALAAAAAVLIVSATTSPTKQARPPVARRASTYAVSRGSTSVSSESAARTFLSNYVAFLYGRADGAAVTPVSPSLHRRLLGAQSTPTPAEITRALVVRDLTVSPDTPATAVGNAVIEDGASPPYVLTFDLRFSQLRWLVTAVRRGVR